MKHFTVLSLLLLPAVAIANTGPATTDELEMALRDVLSHSDLFDAEYVSGRLGLGFRLYEPQKNSSDDSKRITAMVTSNPPALYGNSIEYTVDIDFKAGASSARFVFAPRQCPSLKKIAGDRQVNIQPDRLGPHAPAGLTAVSMTWPGSEGIGLGLQQWAEGGCLVTLTQRVKRVANMKCSPLPTRLPADELTNKLASVLLAGDLRDYTKIGRILGADLVVNPDTTRNALLYRGSAALGRVIPGLDPMTFLYTADDVGWARPPNAFIALPIHMADRIVVLNLRLDTDTFCVSPLELTSALTKRSRSIRTEKSEDADEQVYSVRGGDLVTLYADFENGCLVQPRFHQVTDIDQSVSRLLVFEVAGSLDGSGSSLSKEAQRKIRLLAARLRAVPNGNETNVMIAPVVDYSAPQSAKHDAEVLAQMITVTLVKDGIGKTTLRESPDVGDAGCHAQAKTSGPFVCVDVWLSGWLRQ